MNLKKIILTFICVTALYSCADFSVKDGMKNSGYDSPNVIEVSMDHSLYPLKTDNPSLLFDKEKLKQVQFT